MMEIDSYLKSVYDKTQNISSASFTSFFDDAIDVTNQFQEATNSMSEGIKSSWDDAVRIIFSGTASQITEQFNILNNSIERLTPIGGYVDQFNDLMREYIQSVKQVNTLEAEKNAIRVPPPPTNTKDKESSGDQCLEQSEIFARETALHRIRELEEKIKKEEEETEFRKDACEGMINKISEILSYHSQLGSGASGAAGIDVDYDDIDYETYEDEENGTFHYYVNYYKDGKLVRRDYETHDGDCSSKGTKIYYDNITNNWGDQIEVVKEDHIEYSKGYGLDGFNERTDTVVENGVLKYDENGRVVLGSIEKYSYTKLPNPDSIIQITDEVEYNNYSFTMDPTHKLSDSYYFDNQRVLTTEKYDERIVSGDDGDITITNGYSVTRTPENRRLTEHKDSVINEYERDGETISKKVQSNYNFEGNPDGSSKATWDEYFGKEGYYDEYDKEGHNVCYGYARHETEDKVVTDYRCEINGNERVFTIGSKTNIEVNDFFIEKDVTMKFSGNGDLSRTVGTVDLLNKDGSIGKRLEGVTEIYDEAMSGTARVMRERTIDHVYHADGTVENNVHDYLVDHAGNTSRIDHSEIESITARDGSVIESNVRRDFPYDYKAYYEAEGTYGYDKYSKPEGYVYCVGGYARYYEPSISYDNERNFYYDDEGNYHE